jgi:hypothetical protein
VSGSEVHEAFHGGSKSNLHISEEREVMKARNANYYVGGRQSRTFTWREMKEGDPSHRLALFEGKAPESRLLRSS